LNDLVQAGHKAWQAGDTQKARALAEQALTEAEAAGDRVGIIAALHLLAARVHFDGDTERAIELQHRLIDLQTQEYGADSLELVPNLTNLASMCGALGDTESQESALRRSLALMDQCHLVNDSYATALYNLALTLREQGRQDEYVDAIERCLTVSRGVIRGDDPYLADALRLVGKVRVDQCRWDEAEELLTSALVMARAFNPRSESMWFARFPDELGWLYATHQRWVDALPHFEEAYKAASSASTADSHPLANIMSGLGVCLGQTGQPERAEPLLSEALHMFVRLDADEDTLGRAALNLAAEYERDGRTDVARELRVKYGVGRPEPV
jgi:tetratricopeptide (TPR) repeat protein